jgi:ParB-like nuclease domain
MTSKRKSWRDVLLVHPAADMFPLMSEAELRELGKDIKKNGLQCPIIMWAADGSGTEAKVLDGRNRLDAMEAVGLKVVDQKDGCIRWNHNVVRFWDVWPGKRTFEGKEELQRCPSINDPYEYVISANIHRRHLTAEQKRELIGKLLKAEPTKSDRAIAKATKTDHKTVASVRAKKERRGEIPHVKTRTDTKGRKQPTKKRTAVKVEPKPTPAIAPTATTAKSWKVEVIAKDGRRYGNGVRLATEEEADAYRFNAVEEIDRKDQLIVVVRTEVIPCADPGGFHQILRRKNGKLTHTLEFVHGACGTLEWEEIATPAKVEPERKSEPTLDIEPREITAIEIERLASRLISKDRDSAREVYRLLRADDGHGVSVLASALGRGLGNGDADDYPDMSDSLRRTPETT